MKLGPHVLLQTPQAIAFASWAPIVKCVDLVEPFKVARPDAIRVFRHWFGRQEFTDPAGAAVFILDGLKGYRHPKLLVELQNETAQTLATGLREHLCWTVDVATRLHDAGLKVAGFSFSTGQPERDDWRFLQDHAFGMVDAISIHQYWQHDGLNADQALRHRQVHEWLSGEHLPFIITECGRDCSGDEHGGWKEDGIRAEQYVAELVTYDAELAKDCYVCGATVFTAGPSPTWATFSTDDLDLRALATAAPPPVEVTPVTADEFDRWSADVWARAGVQYVKDNGIPKYWRASARAGHYYGRPEGPEHRTENGQYAYQEFSGAVLHCRVGEWIVSEGLPPFA
jgi:hypothetical protein